MINNTFWELDNGVKLTLDELNSYLDDNSIPIVSLCPTSIKHLLIDVDRCEKRIDGADLSYPIIIAKKNGEIIRICDGQHRLAKCLKNGIDIIKIRELDLNKSPQIYKNIFD